MKTVRITLIVTVMSGISLGALPLTVAASHYHPERPPNGVVWEPITPAADGGSRTTFPWSRN